MVWFLQKREILEYCGKDWKAVRWLDGQIRDGLIIYDIDRGYIKVWEYWQEAYDEAKRRFNEEVEKIEKEKSELEKRLEGVDIDKIEEYKANAEYYQNLWREERGEKDRKIRKAFAWIKQNVKWANWDEFRDWVMSNED